MLNHYKKKKPSCQAKEQKSTVDLSNVFHKFLENSLIIFYIAQLPNEKRGNVAA